jgi:hypothetical protein
MGVGAATRGMRRGETPAFIWAPPLTGKTSGRYSIKGASSRACCSNADGVPQFDSMRRYVEADAGLLEEARVALGVDRAAHPLS